MSVLRSAFPWLLILFLILLPGLYAQEDGASPLPSYPEITDEAKAELVNLSIWDSAVSLFISGYWLGKLQANWGIALTPEGTRAFSGDSPVLFTQEADLTLSLWIRETWFVEAGFLDDYDLNTYRAGYQGRPGEIVQYAGIGNTGLDFPAFPYLDLGGDSASSLGFYGRFGGEEFTLHTLVRYDAAAREEKVFVGSRERTFSFADLSAPLRGVSFVLPDDNLDTVPQIYLEDANGPLTDTRGRRWRLAGASEYAAGARYGQVELTLGAYNGNSEEPKGMVGAAYSKGGSDSPWKTSLGEYHPPGLPGMPGTSGFLEKVQSYFNSSGKVYDLALFPQTGGGPERPGETTINGVPVLIIYESGTFSPFEKQNRYRSPSLSAEDASVVSLSRGQRISYYEVIPLESSTSYLPAPSGQVNQRRGIYELVGGASSQSGREESERWPLTKDESGQGVMSWPEIYLPGKRLFTGDLGLRFTNYGSAGTYYIGSDAVPGSVQVYRAGLEDPNFSYNEAGGTVSLANPAMGNETIRITYLKQSGERRLGSFAAGLGVLWDPKGAFSSGIGLGLRWNLSGDSFSETGSSSPGAVGLGAEARYDAGRLKAGVTLGLGFEQPDTTDLYRVLGMEGSEIILALPPGDSFISGPPGSVLNPGQTAGNRAPLVYRNHRDTSIIGTSTLTDIESSAPELSGKQGPYPAMDARLSSQILAAEFTLDASQSWTGFETSLGLDGEILERSKTIEIPFRLYKFLGNTDKLQVIFQAGALNDSGDESPENPDLIFEKLIYDGAAEPQTAPPHENPRLVTLNLNDEDRRKLGSAKYLRILVSAPGLTGTEFINGRVLLAPPLVKGAAFRPVFLDSRGITGADDSPLIASAAVMENREGASSPQKLEEKYGDIIKRLHSGLGSQRILELGWENLDSGMGAGADTRIAAPPLENYRSLSFFVRRPQVKEKTPPDPPELAAAEQEELDKASLRFILARGPQSIYSSRDLAVDVSIPLKDLENAGVKPGYWARVEIRYRGDNTGIFIDGIKTQSISGSSLVPNPSFFSGQGNENVSGSSSSGSAYMAFLLMPPQSASPMPSGRMGIDEVILEDSVASYRLNAGAIVEWQRPGSILSVKNTPVLSDFSVSAALETGARGNPFEENNSGLFGMSGRARSEASILGTRVRANYSYTFSKESVQDDVNSYAWRAGHSISRSWGPFQASGAFEDAPSDRYMEHKVALGFNSVFRSSLSGEARYDDARLGRTWKALMGVKPKEFPLDLSVEAGAAWQENSGGAEYYLENYGKAWVESWTPMVPDWGAGAGSRDGNGRFSFSIGDTPLGLRLYLESSSFFNEASGITNANSLGRLDIPWTPEISGGALRFLFRGEREFRRGLNYRGHDFRNDAARYGESLEDSAPLLFAVPFYSLWNPDLGPAMKSANGSFPANASLSSGVFADRFESSVQLPPNYGVSALFLPSNIAFRVNRVLEQKLDTSLDSFNLGGVLRFQAVNLFGAMGSAPVFKFYRNDEFSYNVEASFSFPKGEKNSWLVEAGQSFNFYGFSGAVLSIENTLSASSIYSVSRGARVSDSLRLNWTSPAEKSLLGALYDWTMDKAKMQNSWLTLAHLAETPAEKIRIETLEFIFGHEDQEAGKDDYTKFSIALGHESVVRITGRINFSVFAKLLAAEDFRSDELSFLLSIGTSLRVTF
jgi:DNA polymerase-4